MTTAERIKKERENTLAQLDGTLIAWTVPPTFGVYLRAIVKDAEGVYHTKEYSMESSAYRNLCWHDIYPNTICEEDVELYMKCFAWGGTDNGFSEIHWVKH